MTAVGGPGALAPNGRRTPAQEDAALRKSARQLEGVFVQQLFKAMRDTVDDDGGLVATGAGETMFRDLFDQHVAERVPEEWDAQHGLAEKLYQQLRARLARGDDGTGSTTAGSPTLPRKET